MSISEDIRSLSRDGLSTADIARRLGIRYQHAYNVLKNKAAVSNARIETTTMAEERAKPTLSVKPTLSAQQLMDSGFEISGRWVSSDAGDLNID